MSNRVSKRACRSAVAFFALTAVSVSLAGCSSLGSAFGDPTVTGSTGGGARVGSMSQPMPQQLQPSAPGTQMAQASSGKYLPPADIGGSTVTPQWNATTATQASGPTVVSQDLPSVSSSSSAASTPTMPQTVPFQTSSSAPAAVKAAPAMPQSASSGGGYTHVIESGESLYAIARKYDVPTDRIIQANNLVSADKIFVGQKLVIPGVNGVPAAAPKAANDTIRTAGLTPKPLPKEEPKAAPVQTAPSQPAATEVASAPAANAPAATPTAPAQPSLQAAAPADGKFRWPVSGRVVTDFAASKGTGINIEVPEGTPVRASETGEVIYVGNAVEGYGNLVLIKHENGYVSAYAHLQRASVAKGDKVNRGDAIGSAGMTGSVTRPQLHFELRKGAAPVDPMPLLAG